MENNILRNNAYTLLFTFFIHIIVKIQTTNDKGNKLTFLHSSKSPQITTEMPLIPDSKTQAIRNTTLYILFLSIDGVNT
jgi:hypothetical protein